jgi:ParB family chromosome partitioning protein
MLIPITKILPNPEQPRKEYDQAALKSLAESIKEHGLINPIAVETAGDSYILIDGERRWRAARMAGLTEIEASVRPGLNGSGSLERLILATVANLQHEDMNPVDKANAFKKLLDTGLTHYAVANNVNSTVATVDNYLLILRLPDPIQDLIATGKLGSSRAVVSALLNITDSSMQLIIALSAAKKNLSDIGVVALARRMQAGKRMAKRNKVKSREELSVTWAGKWNMIAQAGNPHISFELRTAAVEVCQACPLFDDASPKLCRECPAPQLLKKVANHAAPIPGR